MCLNYTQMKFKIYIDPKTMTEAIVTAEMEMILRDSIGLPHKNHVKNYP